MPLSHHWFHAGAFVLILLGSRAAADESGPRDLIDVATIQGLSLEDLGWQEESRSEVDGTWVISGSWIGPRFEGFDGSLDLFDVRLREAATLYIPASLDAGTSVHPIVWAAHYAPLARQVYGPLADTVASAPVAYGVHGEEESDWTSLGFSSRDDLVAMTLLILTLANECAPQDYRFGNYLLALAETNLMALTLLERHLEAEGLAVAGAGIVGYSKEGLAAWLASAVDSRLVAAAPGGWHLEDLVEGLSAEEARWGCGGTIGGAVDGTTLLTFRNWLEVSEGGRRASQYFSVSEFSEDLYPELFLLHGDVGLHDMHDGLYYTPGAETGFLERFRARPFRYDRVPDHGERESDDDRNSRMAGWMAHYLVTRDASEYPKVESAELERVAGRFRVRATTSGDPETVRLWWSHSDDAPFDDPDNPPWVVEPLGPDGSDWTSAWIDVSESDALGWYIEAERSLPWLETELVVRDASPQRFSGGPAPLTCARASVPECTPFLRGDSNLDDRLDLSDALTTLRHLFLGDPPALRCEDAGDLDDDGELTITDPIYLLQFLFLGGPTPRSPHGACAVDPAPDTLTCREYPPCLQR